MKRMLAVILVLVISIGLTTSFAEEEFFSGLYTVGKDFKEGSYNIRLERNGNGDAVGMLEVWNSEDDFSKRESLYCLSFGIEGIHISVTEGMVFGIMLMDGDAKLTIVADKLSWML